MPDMAQAYIQFASSENERELEEFLKLAESESNDSPHHGWNASASSTPLSQCSIPKNSNPPEASENHIIGLVSRALNFILTL
jgi:hypothetical protein